MIKIMLKFMCYIFFWNIHFTWNKNLEKKNCFTKWIDKVIKKYVYVCMSFTWNYIQNEYWYIFKWFTNQINFYFHSNSWCGKDLWFIHINKIELLNLFMHAFIKLTFKIFHLFRIGLLIFNLCTLYIYFKGFDF
jgi:hypothetical protein